MPDRIISPQLLRLGFYHLRRSLVVNSIVRTQRRKFQRIFLKKSNNNYNLKLNQNLEKIKIVE